MTMRPLPVAVLVVGMLGSYGGPCPGRAAQAPPADPSARAPAPAPSGGPLRRTLFESGGEPFAGLSEGQVTVRIRAQVNNIAILDEEVRQSCYRQLVEARALPEPERANREKEILERSLQDLIDREVILQDLFARVASVRPQYMDKLKDAARKEFERQVRSMKANVRKAGIEVQKDEDLDKILRQQGQSLEFLRRQAERQFMAMEYMRSRIFPKVEHIGHEQIVEYYRQHAEEFRVQDSVRWQDIFIDVGRFANRDEARKFAEQLAERARKGEDFSRLLAYDNGDSSYRNGEGYGQKRGEIKPAEVEPILFRMHDQEVGPVIGLANGFHVIRLVKRQYAGLKPLDAKTQEEIRRKLQNEVADREYKRLLAELKRRATVEINRD